MVDYKYDEKTKRTYIVLKEPTWGGLSSKEETYIDTNHTYTNNKKQVFMTYPDMVQIDNSDPRTEFLNGCLRRIKFEKTGDIEF